MSPSPLDGVRLVALDLDGTLLPSHKRVSERAKRVVLDLADAGITTVLATGRGWNSTVQHARDLGLTGPLVTFEGALVAFPAEESEDAARAAAVALRRPGAAVSEAIAAEALASPVPDTRRFLHHRTLGADLLRRAVGTTLDLNVGFFVATDAGRIVASRRVLEERLHQIAIWDRNVHFVDTWEQGSESGYILHFIGPPADVREAERRVHALGFPFEAFESFHAEFWDGYDQFQIRPTGIGKDVGLRHVLTHFGLTPHNLLAAGDWHNDVGMLKLARVAVAPANAVAAIRDIAHHVLPGTSDDDAVVVFLEDALRGL